MSIYINEDDAKLFQQNGYSYDDVNNTVQHYRNSGLSDENIQQKINLRLNEFKSKNNNTTAPNFRNKSASNNTQTQDYGKWGYSEITSAPAKNIVSDFVDCLKWVKHTTISAYQSGVRNTDIADLETKDMFHTIKDEEKKRLEELSSTPTKTYKDYGIINNSKKKYIDENETNIIPRIIEPFSVVANDVKKGYVEAINMLPYMWETIKAGGIGAGVGAGVGAVAGTGVGLATGKVNTVPLAMQGARVGASWGGRITGSVKIAELEGGLARNEIKQINQEIIEKGGDPLPEALIDVLAISVGAVNAGLETVGLKQVLKTVPGGDKILSALEKKNVRELVTNQSLRTQLEGALKQYAKTMGTEITTEMAQETTNIVADEIARKFGKVDNTPLEQNVARVIQTGKATFGAMAFIGGVGTAAKATTIMVQQGMPVKEAKKVVDNMTPEEKQEFVEKNYDTLMENVKQNSTPQTSTEKIEKDLSEKFIENKIFTKEKDAKSVAYLFSAPLQKLSKVLGISLGDLMEDEMPEIQREAKDAVSDNGIKYRYVVGRINDIIKELKELPDDFSDENYINNLIEEADVLSKVADNTLKQEDYDKVKKVIQNLESNNMLDVANDVKRATAGKLNQVETFDKKNIENSFDDTVENITDGLRADVENILNENEIDTEDFNFEDIRIYGSYSTGKNKETSDIDVLVQYSGSMREDDAFNMFHEQDLFLTDKNGNQVEVDINPINTATSGTIDDKLEQMHGYNDTFFQTADTAGAKEGEISDAKKELFQTELLNPLDDINQRTDKSKYLTNNEVKQLKKDKENFEIYVKKLLRNELSPKTVIQVVQKLPSAYNNIPELKGRKVIVNQSVYKKIIDLPNNFNKNHKVDRKRAIALPTLLSDPLYILQSISNGHEDRFVVVTNSKGTLPKEKLSIILQPNSNVAIVSAYDETIDISVEKKNNRVLYDKKEELSKTVATSKVAMIDNSINSINDNSKNFNPNGQVYFQSSNNSYKERLNEVKNGLEYKKFVEKVLSNKLSEKENRNLFTIGKTPDKLVEAGVPNNNLTIGAKIIRKAQGNKNPDHNLSKETISKVWKALHDPIAVIENKPNKNEAPDKTRVAVILDLQADNNDYVMVAIEINKKTQTAVVNDIRSIHSRKNFAPILDAALKEKRILKVDIKKVKDLPLISSELISEGAASLLDSIYRLEKNVKYHQSANGKEKIKPINIETDAVPDFEKMKDLKQWIFDNLKLLGNIEIKSNKKVVQFSKTNLNRSLKGVNRNNAKKNSYSGLRELVENSIYGGERYADKRHENKVKGQELYYNAFNHNGKIYGVEIAIDIPKTKNAPNNYAGHKIKEIKIAPVASEVSSNELTFDKPDATISITDIQKLFNPNVKYYQGENDPAQLNLFYDNIAPRKLRNMNIKGAFVPAENLIELFKNADESTIIHEFAHWWLSRLEKYATRNEELALDLAEVRKFVKNDGGKFTREQHEKFARGFEAYIRNGSARSNRLKRIFEDFKNALIQIYDSIKRLVYTENGEEYSFSEDDVANLEKLFERLLTTENERIKETVFDKCDDINERIKDIKAHQEEEMKELDALWEGNIAAINRSSDIKRKVADYLALADKAVSRVPKEVKEMKKRYKDATLGILSVATGYKPQYIANSRNWERVEMALEHAGDKITTSGGMRAEWSEFYYDTGVSYENDEVDGGHKLAEQAFQTLVDGTYNFNNMNEDDIGEFYGKFDYLKARLAGQHM